jgi:hypothetical protein
MIPPPIMSTSQFFTLQIVREPETRRDDSADAHGGTQIENALITFVTGGNAAGSVRAPQSLL